MARMGDFGAAARAATAAARAADRAVPRPDAVGQQPVLADLLGEPSAFHAFAPAWRPVFWNLADQTPEALLNSGMEWLQTLAVVRVEAAEEAEFRAVYEEAVRRLHDLRGRDKVAPV